MRRRPARTGADSRAGRMLTGADSRTGPDRPAARRQTRRPGKASPHQAAQRRATVPASPPRPAGKAAQASGPGRAPPPRRSQPITSLRPPVWTVSRRPDRYLLSPLRRGSPPRPAVPQASLPPVRPPRPSLQCRLAVPVVSGLADVVGADTMHLMHPSDPAC